MYKLLVNLFVIKKLFWKLSGPTLMNYTLPKLKSSIIASHKILLTFSEYSLNKVRLIYYYNLPAAATTHFLSEICSNLPYWTKSHVCYFHNQYFTLKMFYDWASCVWKKSCLTVLTPPLPVPKYSRMGQSIQE